MKENIKEILPEVLGMFCGDYALKELEWEKTPFLNTRLDQVWATDGHAVMMVPKGLVSVDAVKDDLSLPWLHLACDWKEGIKVPVSRITAAIAACPTEDEMTVGVPEETCPECDGTGEVTWSYSALHGDQHFYDREFECPVCCGSGVIVKEVRRPTGRKVPVKGAALHIRTADYAVYQMQRIVRASEMLGVEEIRILHIPTRGPGALDGLMLGFSEDIRVFVMPCIPDDQDKVARLDI